MIELTVTSVPIVNLDKLFDNDNRFELILKTRSRNRRSLGALMVVGMIALSIITTSLVFAEAPKAPKPLVERGGAIYTYYNYAQTLEENVRDRLGIKLTTDNIHVIDVPIYIDVTGRKLDVYNRTEPHYKIDNKWKQKNSGLEGMINKTLSIEGKTVTVAFADKAAAYKDDPVIEQMIRNQITFELSYHSNHYDHQAFINELIERGAYVIQDVTEPKDFKFEELMRKPNGDALDWRPLTRYDKKKKLVDIFNNKIKLPKNIDGNQGTQLGNSFVIKKGEILAIDIKEATDKMPGINFAIFNVTKGELAADWIPFARSGYRIIYTPGQLSANDTFKVVMSGEESDIADIEIFTYKGAE